MKSKQIPLTREEMTQEEILFLEVMKRFDYATDKIVGFFGDFLDLTTAQIRAHTDPNASSYHSIAKQMLPLDG